MSNYMQYLLSSDNEYVQHNIKQRITEITSQPNISANEIKSKVDAFPDISNIKLLKNSVQLLYKRKLLTKENLALIGNEQNFKVSYFSNGILNKLDAVNLIDQETLEWILKAPLNVLFWNISILHKNDRLTPQNLKALKDERVSNTLSDCFEYSLLPQHPPETVPERARIPFSKNFISGCSDTFFNFGVNPLTTRLPSEFENSFDSNYRATFNNNLLLANVFVSYVSALLGGKPVSSYEKPTYNHRTIYEKLEKIENRLNEALKKFANPNEENFASATTSTFFTLKDKANMTLPTTLSSQQNTSLSP